jgi:hypothetical protein
VLFLAGCGSPAKSAATATEQKPGLCEIGVGAGAPHVEGDISDPLAEAAVVCRDVEQGSQPCLELGAAVTEEVGC